MCVRNPQRAWDNRVFDVVGLGIHIVLRVCVWNKFLGGVDAVGPRTPLCKALL